LGELAQIFDVQMGFTVECSSCGARRTVPQPLFDDRIRGRVVNIPCKGCGAAIRIDGTMPPPPVAEMGSGPKIPIAAAVPRDPMLLEKDSGGSSNGASRSGLDEGWEEHSPSVPVELTRRRSSAPPPPSEPGEASDPGTPGMISHVDGPISERGPVARIGRYALFEQFAAGGMATVHFGRLDGAGGFSRVVAIKRLLPHLLDNRDFTEMLLNEARLAARVRHPNVVATLDVVASKGDVLLVLDYVPGEALSTLCRTQAKERKDFVPVEIAIGIMQDVLSGLRAIHEATDERGRSLDLVHCDVSPPNVIVGADGMSRVLDFGIAKALEQLEEAQPERREGKLGYMSPEQIEGGRLTQRSDVFSAGIVFWELLALKRMFTSGDETERSEKILSGKYPHPKEFRPELPDELDALVMRALARDPEARFATIREFAEALDRTATAASRTRIADWVKDLAQPALAERTRMVARVENWAGIPLIPLSSSPFASDAPSFPLIGEASSDEPSDLDGSAEEAAPPAKRASSRPPKKDSVPTKKEAAVEAKAKSGGSAWWIVVVVIALVIAGYFVSR
jgi:serine/threonine-protein kinase